MSIERVSLGTSLRHENFSTMKESKRDDQPKVDNSNEQREVSKADLEKAVEKVNEFMKPIETSIQFELHEKLDEYYVKVINKETNEVIKEIPSKKMLDMYAAMAELMGLIVNERV